MEEGLPYAVGDLINAPGVSYRVEAVLGVGGMGFVLRALERELNDTVVLKFLKPAWVKPMADRFAREARAIRKIKDINVVAVERLGVTSDGYALPFYQMENIAGRPLHQVRAHAGGTFALRSGLNLAAQLTSGLVAIHERGLIHRDIKPANLLLCRPGTETLLKIIDLGIAILIDEAKEGEFWGTPPYAAPEQLLQRACTPAVDVYAAGLVIFEALAGEHPYASFHGKEDGFNAALRRVDAPAPALSKYGEFPPTLVRLVARALDRDPAKRPEALKLAIELKKINGALEPINVHEVATDPGLGNSGDPSPQTEVRHVTHADLGNPTDQDADMPRLMAAMRSMEKRAAILGVAPTELPIKPGGVDPSATDTEPGGPPVFDTVPTKLPNVRVTAPMEGRPIVRAEKPRLDEAVTDPPSFDLPSPVSKSSGAVEYVEAPSPAPSRNSSAKRAPLRADDRVESVNESERRSGRLRGLAPVGAALVGAAIVVALAFAIARSGRSNPASPSPASSAAVGVSR